SDIVYKGLDVPTRTRSTDTSDGLAAIQAQLNNLGREIKKVNEKVYAAQYGVPFPLGGRFRAAAPGFYQRANRNPSYQERRQTMQESMNRFMAESAKRHDENSNLIKEIRSSTDTIPFPSRLIDDYYNEMNVLDSATYGAFEEGQRMEDQVERPTCEDSLPQKEKDPRSFTLTCYINNVCFEKALADLGASVSVIPLTTFTNLGLGNLAPTKLTMKLANKTIKFPKGIAENVLVEIGKFVFPVDFIVLDIPKDIKVLLILRRPFLSTSYAKLICGQYGYLPNQGMGEVIVGEPFCKSTCVEARRFDGMITIRNGDDSVTYQMVQSHLRFKHFTNEKCNKIPPLLKVRENDKLNRISHSYQKLKSFYKGVLNLGAEFIRDVKTKEWLTRGHISVHKME
ncbi:hypothetical protein Tco_1290908, partial [Tanacetum coccineum]